MFFSRLCAGLGVLSTLVAGTAFVAMTPNRCAAADANTATPIDRLKIKPGFQVELLYSVPKAQQGSWVSMCTIPGGKLIVGDQYGSLYEVTPARGRAATKIEKIDVQIGAAQGLLWAFDSLYVVVNARQFPIGLHRVTDSDGDGKLDTVKQLRGLQGGGGEHGPHAVLLSPSGKSLYIVCGNQTQLTKLADSRVPQVWDEDNLLPRVYGRGFMRGTPAPGGCIYEIDPDGQNWTLISNGFRNEYDAALNRDGELFTLRCRHGMGHEHAVVSAHAGLPCRQRGGIRLAKRSGANGRHTTPTACRR